MEEFDKMSKADLAAEKKQLIVGATVACIAKHGYHNFSMQDVAKKAGVSKGIIHYYFLNKDELMTSVLEQVAKDIEFSMEKAISAKTDPLLKIERFLDLCFDIVKDSTEYYQVSMDFWTQINQKEKVKTMICEHYKTFRLKAVELLEYGIKKGAFQAELDTHYFASFIIALVDGFSIQWLFDQDSIQFHKVKTKTFEIVKTSLVN